MLLVEILAGRSSRCSVGVTFALLACTCGLTSISPISFALYPPPLSAFDQGAIACIPGSMASSFRFVSISVEASFRGRACA